MYILLIHIVNLWGEIDPFLIRTPIKLGRCFRTSYPHRDVLPLGASSGEDETLPDVVPATHARGAQVSDEPSTISTQP